MNAKQLKLKTASATATLMFLASAVSVIAGPKGAQTFDVYFDTSDGLDVSVDADVGNVEVVANPGGQDRLIIQTHLQKAAPNCEYTVQLVTEPTDANNGGLDENGHTGIIKVLGTLTTNRVGNGNAHFDLDPDETDDGVLDTVMYGHLDFEDMSGTCVNPDNTPVTSDQYGAAPDPNLSTPLTWMQ